MKVRDSYVEKIEIMREDGPKLQKKSIQSCYSHYKAPYLDFTLNSSPIVTTKSMS